MSLSIALGIAVSGCTSIYHRTRAELPPEPAAEAQLRIAEAQRAETAVSKAAGTLRDHLSRGMPAETVRIDLDRLGVAANDLERRALAAHDAAARCEGSPMIAEVERLQRRAEAWNRYVQTSRPTDAATQLRQLDKLLQRSAPP